MRFTPPFPKPEIQTRARRFAWLLLFVLPLAAHAVAIADTQLPVGVAQAPYPVFSLTATAGAAPFTWSIAAGALPAGLTLQPGGLITGTPTVTGNFSVTFRVTDAGVAQTTRAFTQSVIVPPAAGNQSWGRRGLFAGFINDIAVSPNYATDDTLFANGFYDDIYRSTDRGASWLRILLPAIPPTLGNNRTIRTLQLPASYRYDTAVQPVEEKTVFVISGDLLRKSINHGAAYTTLRCDAVQFYCYGLALSPAYGTDRTLWLVEHDQVAYVDSLYRSTDGGTTWSLRHTFSAPLLLSFPADLKPSPNFAADNTLFMPLWNTSTSVTNLYKSTDGGTSWNTTGPLTAGDSPKEYAVSPKYATDQTLLMVPTRSGGANTLYRSTNGGASWSPISNAAFVTGKLSGLQFVNRGALAPWSLLYSQQPGERYSVLRSDDYGTTWVPLPGFGQRNSTSLSNYGNLSASPLLTGGVVDLFFGSILGLDASSNDGVSYEPSDKNIDAVYYSRGIQADVTVAGTTMASLNGWFKTADSGQTWVRMPGVASAAGNAYGLRPYIPPNYALDRSLFLGWSDGLYRSTDGGVTSTLALGPPPRDVGFADNFRVSSGTMFVGTRYGLDKSTNGGASFTAVSSASGSCIFPFSPSYSYSSAEVYLSPKYSGDSTVIANLYENLNGVGPWVCKSADGGATWTQILNDSVYTLAYAPMYDDRAANGTLQKLVLLGGYGWLRRSLTGGTAATDVTGLPAGVSVYAIAFSPNFALDGTVLAGTTNGIYRSSDNGVSFAPLAGADQLKYRSVAGIYLAPGFDGRLSANSTAIATTYGNGKWISNDGGRTFVLHAASGFVSQHLNGLAGIPGTGAVPKLLASSTDHGVMQSDDGGLTFTNISKGMAADSNVLAVTAPSALPARPLAARNADGLWRYDNATSTWSRHPSAGSGDYRAFGEDGTYLYAMRRDGVSLRSSDGGATWVNQDASKTDLISFSSDGSAGAPIVSNGDFEQPYVPGALTLINTGGTIGAWSVVSGSVDQIGSYWQAADGRQSLDMSGNAAGAISQTLATTAGTQYTLRFSLAANPDTVPACGGPVKTLQVYWNGSLLAQLTFDRTGHSTASMGWVTQQYTVTATAATTPLRFVSLDAGVCGPALDAVSVTPYGVPLQNSPSPKLPGSVTASLWSASAAQGPQFSYNSGINWTSAPGSGDYTLPGGQGWQVIQALGLDAGTGGRIVSAGTATGLWLTRDGGLSWRSASGTGSGLESTSKNVSALISAPNINGTTDLLVGVNGTTNGGVYLSGDGGEHWSQINQGFDPNSLNITTLAKTSCSGCPVQYYSGTYGSGVYTRTIPVVPAPNFPSVSAACFGSTGCAPCVSAAGSGPEQGGQAFRLCGAAFLALATVEFDGIPATGCTTASATVITCTGTPPHVPGAATIRVRNTDTRTGYLPNDYNYVSGTPRAANLRITKSGSNASLTWTCASCSVAAPARIYRSQNVAFSLNVEEYSNPTSPWSNTGALAAGANPSYFWSVE